LLELLLFYCVPRRDTNELAHQLIVRFGTLTGVLDADVNELMSIPGIGEHAATLLKFIPHIARRYRTARAGSIAVVDSVEKAGRYLLDYFFGYTVEVVYALFLSADQHVRQCARVSGNDEPELVHITPRRLVHMALDCGADKIILAHNHPGGNAMPSPQDRAVTEKLALALDAVGIKLVDHLVIAGDDFVSFLDSGWI
jgi:DNA repair protein RadC